MDERERKRDVRWQQTENRNHPLPFVQRLLRHIHAAIHLVHRQDAKQATNQKTPPKEPKHNNSGMLLIETLVETGQLNGLHKNGHTRVFSTQNIQQQLTDADLRAGASKCLRPRVQRSLPQHHLLRATSEKRVRINAFDLKVQRYKRVQIQRTVLRVQFEQETPASSQTIQTLRLRFR